VPPYPCALAEFFVIVRQMQETFRDKGKTLYFGFIDLEKAFDRIPREVIRWVVFKLEVEEWLVSAIMSFVICDCHVIVISAFRERKGEFRVTLPWQLLYSDDLVAGM